MIDPSEIRTLEGASKRLEAFSASRSYFWTSWYLHEDATCEICFPHWISGYTMDNRAIICARIPASSREEALALARASITSNPTTARFEERFCEPANYEGRERPSGRFSLHGVDLEETGWVWFPRWI